MILEMPKKIKSERLKINLQKLKEDILKSENFIETEQLNLKILDKHLEYILDEKIKNGKNEYAFILGQLYFEKVIFICLHISLGNVRSSLELFSCCI